MMAKIASKGAVERLDLDYQPCSDRVSTERSHRPSTSSTSKSHKLPGKIHLTDLCPEDKARIGDLLHRLAEEKSQRLAVLSARELERNRYETEIRKLQEENKALIEELSRSRKERQGSPKALKVDESTISLSETPQQSITFRSPDRISPTTSLKSTSTSPLKSTATLACSQSIGTQTTTDKCMQSDTPLVTPRNVTPQSRSKPSAEIKTLRQDIATLSMSLRNFGESVPGSSRGGKHFRFDSPPIMTASPVIKTGYNPISTPSQARKTEEEPGSQPHFDIFSPRDLTIKPSKLTLNIPRSPIPERGPGGVLDESQTVDYSEELFSMIEELERRAGSGDLNTSRMVEVIEEMERESRMSSSKISSLRR
jgi:hypothetical protein